MSTANRTILTDERQEIKDAIDSLSERRLEPAAWFINFIIASSVDPVERLLANAPLDDEEVTDEDLAAFAETDEDFRTGNTYTQEEVERELGLRAAIWEDAN